MQDHEYEDPEYDEPGEEEDDEESVDLLPCPECGAEVYEEAERCPACGNYIVHESSVWSGRPFWWILLGGLGMLLAVLGLLLGSLVF
jgi:hypothetical protein